MKFLYIVFFIIFLTSCVLNIKKEEKISQEEPRQIEILTNNIYSSTPKELEFTITHMPDDKYVSEIDDESITKYVNDTIHYTNIQYTPDDLEKITGKYILDTKWNQTLRKEANLYLQELSKAFYEKFQVKLKIVSAYRSYNYQVGIKKWGCSDLFCAKAGYSEHQSGLAFDMFEATSQKEFLSKQDLKKYFEWMQENAHKYGFHNSYQKGKEIDGYAIEPWHWRYLWIDFATELQEKNMTYAEYYKLYWQK